MRILLTSFATWMPHQRSNASDELLQALLDRDRSDYHLLRNLPVDFELAPKLTIDKADQLQPDVTICCGMAESRQKLSLESNGKFQSEILRSPFDLEKLIEGTIATEISHDAGNFVCNYLYYSVLKQLKQPCLFVHVPILTEANTEVIVQDFLSVLKQVKNDRTSEKARSRQVL